MPVVPTKLDSYIESFKEDREVLVYRIVAAGYAKLSSTLQQAFLDSLKDEDPEARPDDSSAIFALVQTWEQLGFVIETLEDIKEKD